MALTQAHLDRLETALTRGELTVESDGERVTYRSIAELRQAIDYVKQSMAQASGLQTTQSFAQFTRD